MRLGIEGLHIVKRIMFNSDIYNSMADDYGLAKPISSDVTSMLLMNKGLVFLHPNPHSLFMFVTQSITVCDVHTMILPEGRGSQAVVAARDALKWLFTKTQFEKVVTQVPTFNRPAEVFAKRVGLKIEGVNRKSFRRDGELVDQTVLGICKEDICQQYQY